MRFDIKTCPASSHYETGVCITAKSNQNSRVLKMFFFTKLVSYYCCSVPSITIGVMRNNGVYFPAFCWVCYLNLT